MAHYAKVNQGKVVNVIVADQDFIDNFVDTSPGKWIQTSFNTLGGKHYLPDLDENNEKVLSGDQSKALRYNFAGVGGYYDKVADAFYAPQPIDTPSWVLDTDTYTWKPPVNMPTDTSKIWRWNESTTSWDEVTY
jgi:hypothetical protein